jgi:hypothetical protein
VPGKLAEIWLTGGQASNTEQVLNLLAQAPEETIGLL